MSHIFTKEENIEWSKSLPGKMTSACLIIRYESKVLMVKAGYKDHWTFPSGIVDPLESPKSAAIRETFEETGISIDGKYCDPFAIIYTSAKSGEKDRFNFAFVTYVSSTDSVQPTVPNDEIEKAAWVSIDDISELSKQKASYVQFQKILNRDAKGLKYIEI